LLSISLFFTANFFSSLYLEPRLIPVIRVLSVSFILGGLSVIHQTVLIKEIDFAILNRVTIISSTMGAITGIIMAISGWGVWSLVLQSLISQITRLILLWTQINWRPKLIFKWHQIQSISHYSFHLFGYKFIDYFHLNADYILIGRFLGSQALGYYYLAYRLISFIAMNVSSIISSTLFPTFSKIQDDEKKLRDYYLKVVKFIAFFTAPLMAGFMFLSKPVVLTVFGEKWLPVALLITILSPVGFSKTIATTLGSIYQSKGRTDLMFYWGTIINLIVVLFLVIGLRWGIIGVATAYALTLPLAYPSYRIAFQLIHLPMRNFLKTLSTPILCSLGMVSIMFAVQSLLPTELEPRSLLGILILVGIVAYFGINFFLNRQQLSQVIRLLRGI